MSRRTFFITLAKYTGIAVSPMLVASGCNSKKKEETDSRGTQTPVTDCSDLSGTSREDMAIREKLAYVKDSPIAENQCQNCNLYLPPPAGNTCGGCMLFKGPVHDNGYCTYWAPRV